MSVGPLGRSAAETAAQADGATGALCSSVCRGMCCGYIRLTGYNDIAAICGIEHQRRRLQCHDVDLTLENRNARVEAVLPHLAGVYEARVDEADADASLPQFVCQVSTPCSHRRSCLFRDSIENSTSDPVFPPS